MATVSKRRDRYVLDFYDHEGKRKWKTMPKGTTLKAAKEQLRKIEEQLTKGNYISTQEIPTFDQVALEWLEIKKLNIRSSTWSVYEGHTRNHFDEFQNLKINRITIKMVDQFIIDRQTKGMNISTLRKILVSLRQIFSLAMKRDYCHKNPMDYADMPKNQGEELGDGDDIRILNRAEISSLLDAGTEQKYHVLFSLAIFSGARQGELLGLKWSDIQWKDSQVHIQKTFNNQRFYDTKTKGSNRKVDRAVHAKKIKRMAPCLSSWGSIFSVSNRSREPNEPQQHGEQIFPAKLKACWYRKNQAPCPTAHPCKFADRPGGKH